MFWSTWINAHTSQIHEYNGALCLYVVGSDRHCSDPVWRGLSWTRAERSSRSSGWGSASDPSHCGAALDSSLRSHLQPSRRHAEPNQTGCTKRGLLKMAHRRWPRMTASWKLVFLLVWMVAWRHQCVCENVDSSVSINAKMKENNCHSAQPHML